jgi:hypothetical protein
VPAAVAMDIIGHESEAINRHYTHIEAAAKRSALRKLPSFSDRGAVYCEIQATA